MNHHQPHLFDAIAMLSISIINTFIAQGSAPANSSWGNCQICCRWWLILFFTLCCNWFSIQISFAVSGNGIVADCILILVGVRLKSSVKTSSYEIQHYSVVIFFGLFAHILVIFYVNHARNKSQFSLSNEWVIFQIHRLTVTAELGSDHRRWDTWIHRQMLLLSTLTVKQMHQIQPWEVLKQNDELRRGHDDNYLPPRQFSTRNSFSSFLSSSLSGTSLIPPRFQRFGSGPLPISSKIDREDKGSSAWS